MKKLNVMIQLPIFSFYRMGPVNFSWDDENGHYSLMAPESLGEQDYNVYNALCEMDFPESVRVSDIAKMLDKPARGGHLSAIKKSLERLGNIQHTFQNCLLPEKTITTSILQTKREGKVFYVSLPDAFKTLYQERKFQYLKYETWQKIPGGLARRLWEFLERRQGQISKDDGFVILEKKIARWLPLSGSTPEARKRMIRKIMKQLEGKYTVEEETVYRFKKGKENESIETNQGTDTQGIQKAFESDSVDESQTPELGETRIPEGSPEIPKICAPSEGAQEPEEVCGCMVTVEEVQEVRQCLAPIDAQPELKHEPKLSQEMAWILDEMASRGDAIDRKKEAQWFYENISKESFREYFPKFKIFWEDAKRLGCIGREIIIKKSVPAYVKFSFQNQADSDFSKLADARAKAIRENRIEKEKIEGKRAVLESISLRQTQSENALELWKRIMEKRSMIPVTELQEKVLAKYPEIDVYSQRGARIQFFGLVKEYLGFESLNVAPSEIIKVSAELCGATWPLTEVQKRLEEKTKELENGNS